jgi:hypothetical protein
MKFNHIVASAVSCLIVCLISFTASAEPVNEHAVLPVACKVALRIITSPDYVKDHRGEIPDAEKMDENAQIEFVANLFNDTIKKTDDEELYCSNTIRDNLSYTSAYHFPQQCVEFLPLLKKSFEDKISYTKDIPNFVQQRMNDALVEMLIMDETAPEKLVARCEVGIQVMHVDLNDKHLKEKYPLPVTCEAFFTEMEKSMILPSQLDTIKRQRVIFAIENKNTPEKLDAICEEITK